MNSAASKRHAGRPYIVGFGGSLRAGPSTEKAVRLALQAAERAAAQTLLIEGPSREMDGMSRSTPSPATSSTT